MTVKRDDVNQGMIDAAKVMPGSPDFADSVQTDPPDTEAVKDAERLGPVAPTTRRK